MKTVSIVLLSLTAVSSGATWYKGNTHTHSSNSDGSSSPSAVIQWYVGNGYNFLAVTDHNWFSPQEAFGLATTYNTPSFLLLTGEEVTDFASDPDPNKRGAIHILGLNINQRVFTAPPGTPAAEVVRTDTAAIRAARGIPIYAHPVKDQGFATHLRCSCAPLFRLQWLQS